MRFRHGMEVPISYTPLGVNIYTQDDEFCPNKLES